MIAITVDTRRAVVAERELLTTGSAGIPVQFTFSSDWDGLSIFAIFRNAEDMDSRVTVVVPESGAVSLPSECCATEYMGEPVYAGVYGTDGYGNTVIPTVWVSIGELREGASYEGAPGTANPTPDMWAQMEALALSTGAANVELAEAAQEAAETAQTGAEAAQTAAETAQTAAETAQGLAETAQSGAEIARSAAEIAQAGAETAQTAAETAQGKAEDAQAGAEAAQAAAEAAQAAAEEAAASVNIDTEMSTTSEHAVQNKVITAALGGKVDKVSGKQLSTEDYTSAEKTKLAGIAAGAEVNVQADWTQTTTTADDYIKNKPANLVQDASYVHTDNNYTTADKTKLAGIPADADKTVIDDTLTQTGEAADAKATGDAIGTINSALSSLSDEVNDPVHGLAQKAPIIINTASGDIASFADGADDMPIRKLVANIVPKQDLHGQSSPYPAGGGKNKFNIFAIETVADTGGVGSLLTQNNDGTITVKTGIQSNVRSEKFLSQLADLEVGTEYTLTADSTGDSKYIYLHQSQSHWYFGTKRTITQDDLDGYVSFYASGAGGTTAVISNMMMRLSSVTDATFAPYENVCPIFGWTGLSGQRTGKNLLNLDRTSGEPVPTDISNTTSPRVFDITKYYEGARSDNYYYKPYITASIASGIVSVTLTSGNNSYGVGIPVSVIGGETYTFSAVSTNGMVSFGYYDTSWNYIGTSETIDIDAFGKATVTVPSNAKYILVVLRTNAVGNTGTFRNCQLELGSTASAYEEYQGEAFSVSFGQTVYGGSDEVVSGNGTSTMGMVDLGDLNWSYDSGTGSFYVVISDIKLPPSDNVAVNALTSVAPVIPNADRATVSGIRAYVPANARTFYIRGSGYTDVASFKTAMSGQQLVYEMDTPTTFTHDPQEVDTLVGQNNIWVDTGSVEVTYPADTKLYIDKKIAEALA